MLFSDEVEIDHILPFSEILRGGTGSKILCTRQADRTGTDAFGAFARILRGYDWGHPAAS